MGGCTGKAQGQIYSIPRKLKRLPVELPKQGPSNVRENPLQKCEEDKNEKQVFQQQSDFQANLDKMVMYNESPIAIQEIVPEIVERNCYHKQSTNESSHVERENSVVEKNPQMKEQEEEDDLRGTVVDAKKAERQFSKTIKVVQETQELPLEPPREQRKWRRKIVGLSIISEVSYKNEVSVRESKNSSGSPRKSKIFEMTSSIMQQNI